jgi:antitoxin Xre/MbcA/ParS-like protein
MKTFVPLSNPQRQPSHMDAQAEKQYELQQAAQRARLLISATRALGEIATRWALSPDESARMLQMQHRAPDEAQEFEKVSYVLGIYRALTELLGNRKQSISAWLRAPNSAHPFSGNAPIDLVLHGNCDDLKRIRRYLECLLVM